MSNLDELSHVIDGQGSSNKVQSIQRSVLFEEVFEHACDIANRTERPLSSVHILLAFFVLRNPAEQVLLEHGVNEEVLLSLMGNEDDEPVNAPSIVDGLAARAAREYQHGELGCLHALTAMVECDVCIAQHLLLRAGLELGPFAERLDSMLLRGSREEFRLRRPRTESDRITAAFRATDFDKSTADAFQDDTSTLEVPAVDAHAGVTYRLSQRQQNEAGLLGSARARRDDRRSTSPGRRRTDSTDAQGARRDRREVDKVSSTSHSSSENHPFWLDPEVYPWLCQLGRNLSEEAYLYGFDPVVGRDDEIEQTIDILNKRRSNNPCLLGEPGVGKTAIVEGVVARMVQANQANQTGSNRVFIQIDVGAILSGTHLRGALAERLRGLQDEVKQADGEVVVFIDELHTLVGGGGGDGGHDAANELKAALARGEFPCIGATTVDEYRKYIEMDAALERRFSAVHVEEPSQDDTLLIVTELANKYGEHHGVSYTEKGLEAAVRLARRYLHDRRDPDRTLGVLDLAGAVARRTSGESVDERAVARVISRMARVPEEHLLLDEPSRFLAMESILGESLIGQRHVLTAVAETIRRNLAGFAGNAPVGSFLFLGPTGVGKTEMVKALAKFLFGDREALVRFDMSEFMEAHSVSRLIGSPPGYVGHTDGGQLTDRIRRRPYQVVLFDEIEKSHRDLWNILLQILDDGRLTDGQGRTVDFSNTVIVMTSNLGSAEMSENERRIGFDGGPAKDVAERQERMLDVAQRTFPPELWNRIETRLAFYPLENAEVRRIARLILAERSSLLSAERNITFEATDGAIDALIAAGGYQRELGARPMRQAIGREIEAPLAERILSGAIKSGDVVTIDAENGKIVF